MVCGDVQPFSDMLAAIDLTQFLCVLLPQFPLFSLVVTEGRLRRRRYGALCCGRQCQEGAAFAFACTRFGVGESDVTCSVLFSDAQSVSMVVPFFAGFPSF
jgi:hypothetical protein